MEWLEATDGSVMRAKWVAGLFVREVQLPDKGTVFAVCAIYPTGQIHHDLIAYRKREDAIKELKRLQGEIK